MRSNRAVGHHSGAASQQGDAVDALRTGLIGQSVKQIDVISRRIEVIGDVNLRHVEQLPGTAEGIGLGALSLAQFVGLLLPPLLVTLLAQQFGIEAFQRRSGLERIFRALRTSGKEDARKNDTQEAGTGMENSKHRRQFEF